MIRWIIIIMASISMAFGMYVPSSHASSTSIDVWMPLLTALIFVTPATMLVSAILYLRYPSWEKEHYEKEKEKLEEAIKALLEKQLIKIEVSEMFKQKINELERVEAKLKEVG